ncbi:MAG: InlB B-repeat-containing protein, partial [Clostridia bacterium]|nr:InlB B-repeat-containing protein [Clostridia bacterium]
MKSKKKILIISLSVLLAVSLIAAGIVLIAAGSGKVTVNFETNGGAAISSVEVKKGEEISLPQPEARTGYEFNGWYENEDLSGDAIKSAVVNNNVTYYASWEKLGVITLQLDGGNLSSTVLYLKKGANVEAFMRDYVPQKSEHEFGGWYIGEDALSGTLAMAEAVTLTAKYKVAYTVEIFKQNTALNGYEKAEDVFVGYDFAGTSVTPVPAVEGFGVTANPNSVSTIVLSETPSQNKLVLYYDREVYSVLFHSNYPDGSENRTVTLNATYGIPQEVPSDYFKVTGYVQTGWSESAFSGNVDYPVDIIKNSLYNSEEQAAVSYLDVKGNTFLYAVWNKGYSDMYGGDDHVYRLSEDSSEIYLERGEKFFVGSYNKTSGRFTFRKANDDVLMSGILNDDGTFIYRDIERSETSATRFLPNIGLDENERIFFNEYNGLEYQANGESSSGIYTIENGEYAVLFNDGPLSGQTRHFTVEERDINGGNVRVFFLRNEEQYAMGKIYRMASGGRYYREYYTVTLSGYLTATFIMPDSDGNASEVIYTYFTSEDGKTVTLQTSGGATAGVMKLFDMSRTMAGYTGYMLYSSDYDRVYTSSSGQTLTLDGVNSAAYFNGETTITGEYEISASLLGGNIVTVTAGEAPNVSTYKFIIDSVTTDEPVVIDGSSTGETQSVTEYVFEVKNPGYAEYYYSDYAGVYYAPLLVIDDPVGGAAAVYGRNSARSYVKVSEGTVEDVSGNKVYTRSKVYEAEVSTSPIDISSVKSFQFLTGSRAVSSGSYNVNYWFSYVNEDDETVPVAVSYNEKGNGGGKLLLAGGFAKYTVEGNTFTAQYSLSGNLLTFSYLNGMVTNNVYIEIDEENREFLLLDGAPYTAVRYGIKGSAAEGETLSYNGKGGYVYSVAAEGDGEPVTYNGTSESTGFSYGGTEVYTFASEGITFEYVFITVSGKVYFIM